MIGPTAIEISTPGEAIDRVDFLVDGVLAGVARQAPWRIAFDFGSSLEARTVTAKIWTNGFRQVEEGHVRTAALTVNDSLNVDLVEVPIRVRSSREVTATDLGIRENGVEQSIRDVRRERPPAHFAFVLDRSLSMTDGKLEASFAAIRRGLSQLRAGDSASLVLFNHHVAPARVIRGGDLGAPDGAITPSGGTSLRDAVASIATPARTYVIVITDGGDRNSELSDEEALRRISGTRTIVNALVLGDSHTRFLDRAASNTGGRVVSASRTSVAGELGALLADINSRYLVIYQSNASARGWRSVDLKPRRRGIDILSARKGYFAE